MAWRARRDFLLLSPPRSLLGGLSRASPPPLANGFAHQTHYAHGNVAYTGVYTSGLRPLARGRKVCPTSNLTVRLALCTRNVT